MKHQEEGPRESTQSYDQISDILVELLEFYGSCLAEAIILKSEPESKGADQLDPRNLTSLLSMIYFVLIEEDKLWYLLRWSGLAAYVSEVLSFPNDPMALFTLDLLAFVKTGIREAKLSEVLMIHFPSLKVDCQPSGFLTHPCSANVVE